MRFFDKELQRKMAKYKEQFLIKSGINVQTQASNNWAVVTGAGASSVNYVTSDKKRSGFGNITTDKTGWETQGC